MMGLGKQVVCNKNVLVLKSIPEFRGYFYVSLEADAANIVPEVPVVGVGKQATTIVAQVVATRGIEGDRRPPVTVAGKADTTAVVVAAGNRGEVILIRQI